VLSFHLLFRLQSYITFVIHLFSLPCQLVLNAHATLTNVHATLTNAHATLTNVHATLTNAHATLNNVQATLTVLRSL